MRRAYRLISLLSRAPTSAAELTVVRGSSVASIQRFHTSSYEYPSGSRSKWLGFAGVVSFSTALLDREAVAKEPPPPELAPKIVVLYQYEACPFCNKVKGELFFPYNLILFTPLP